MKNLNRITSVLITVYNIHIFIQRSSLTTGRQTRSERLTGTGSGACSILEAGLMRVSAFQKVERGSLCQMRRNQLLHSSLLSSLVTVSINSNKLK